jgi:hypothetical protein
MPKEAIGRGEVELRSELWRMDGTDHSHPAQELGGAERALVSRIPPALASESGHAEPLAEYGSRHWDDRDDRGMSWQCPLCCSCLRVDLRYIFSLYIVVADEDEAKEDLSAMLHHHGVGLCWTISMLRDRMVLHPSW